MAQLRTDFMVIFSIALPHAIGKISGRRTWEFKCIINASMSQAGFTILRVTAENFNGSRKGDDKETDFRASQYDFKSGTENGSSHKGIEIVGKSGWTTAKSRSNRVIG